MNRCLNTGRWPLAVVLISTFFSPFTLAQDLSDARLQQVVDRLAEGATHSWELGTRAQALLELNAPFYSVFTNTTLPPPTSPPSSIPSNLTDVISIAQGAVSKLGNATKPQPLFSDDGAAGDPPSVGVAVLLANWTRAPALNETHPTYAQAAADQLEFLLSSVPRTADGAISHRVSEVQLWSDFIYMVPPFLAYYGAMTQNKSLVAEAHQQIMLYRNYLRDPDADNLWKHIVLGSGGQDGGHWTTGNGWAASGMLRVYATIQNSNFADQFKGELSDLKNWASEILNGVYRHRTDDHLFPNYADNSSTFTEAAGAALLAASTYRLAILTQTYHNLPSAEASRKSITGSHLDNDGWVTPVVNPLDWSASGAHSPESQAFVVQMHAAWKDWVAIGSPGANGAGALRPGVRAVVAGVVIVVAIIGVGMA